MRVQSVSNQNNYSTNFGTKFKLSDKTIQAVEKSTGLTYKELTELSIEESKDLMKKRGTLKEPSKIKTWIADKYRKVGESLGLLKKERNIYTDID